MESMDAFKLNTNNVKFLSRHWKLHKHIQTKWHSEIIQARKLSIVDVSKANCPEADLNNAENDGNPCNITNVKQVMKMTFRIEKFSLQYLLKN